MAMDKRAGVSFTGVGGAPAYTANGLSEVSALRPDCLLPAGRSRGNIRHTGVEKLALV